VLGATALDDERWLLVGTDVGAVVGGSGPDHSFPWTDVEHAAWDGPARSLRIALGWDGRPDLLVRTASDDVYDVSAALRDRVNASIVHVEYLTTTSGGEVRALIRRGIGWLDLLPARCPRPPSPPEDLDAVAALERRARAAAGLPTP
jgi:hypothetical protein